MNKKKKIKRVVEDQMMSGQIVMRSDSPCYSRETINNFVEFLNTDKQTHVLYFDKPPTGEILQGFVKAIPLEDICGTVMSARYIEKRNIIEFTYRQFMVKKKAKKTKYDILTLCKVEHGMRTPIGQIICLLQWPVK